MNKIKTFYSTKRAQKIAITILAILLMIGGATFASLYQPTSSVTTTEVSITLASNDIKEKISANVNVIVHADVEIIDTNGTLVEDLSMTVNEPTKLSATLEAGEYVINMTSSPIESDGSTYKIPSTIDNIVISDEDVGDGKIINVEVSLERIDVEDMTKEQLEVAIERISNEAPDKNKELIEALKKRQETAVSDTSSAKDMQQDSKTEDTPKSESKPEISKPETSKPDTGNSGSSSGSTGGSSDKHTHSWTPNVVNHPAVPAQGYNETIPAVTKETSFYLWSDGCKIEKKKSMAENTDILYRHDTDHGMQNYTSVYETTIITPESSRWIETAPAIPAWSEVIGHNCLCGASK